MSRRVLSESAGLESLEDRRRNICNKFADKCLKNETTKTMFPLREKAHKMIAKEEKKKLKRLKTHPYHLCRMND